MSDDMDFAERVIFMFIGACEIVFIISVGWILWYAMKLVSWLAGVSK